MKTLLIDAGNSSLKWAILENGHFSRQEKQFYAEKSPIDIFEDLLKKYQLKCDSLLMVSVLDDRFNKNAEEMANKVSLSFNKIVSQKELAGLKNAYAEPHKLGADRFVGMIAARHLSKGKACIIIDAGTATTIDAVDEDGQHLGGLILPGSILCSTSLLENTALLPKCNNPDKEFIPELFSKETTQAIASASVLGLAGAIETICAKMEEELLADSKQSNVTRFLCGGDAENILPFMASKYEYHQDLLMTGLQTIAQFTKNPVN